MRYTVSRHFDGDPEQAFQIATMALTSNNFHIISQEKYTVEFEGPGMTQSRQNPLVDSSRVLLALKGHDLVLEAWLGGLKSMKLLIYGLPVVLVVIFLLLFGLFYGERGIQDILLFSVLPVLPWILLSPLMVWWIKKRTLRALDALLDNIIASQP